MTYPVFWQGVSCGVLATLSLVSIILCFAYIFVAHAKEEPRFESDWMQTMKEADDA
jgi:hypothetical protein